jgi:hypothetical protein
VWVACHYPIDFGRVYIHSLHVLQQNPSVAACVKQYGITVVHNKAGKTPQASHIVPVCVVVEKNLYFSVLHDKVFIFYLGQLFLFDG